MSYMYMCILIIIFSHMPTCYSNTVKHGSSTNIQYILLHVELYELSKETQNVQKTITVNEMILASYTDYFSHGLLAP